MGDEDSSELGLSLEREQVVYQGGYLYGRRHGPGTLTLPHGARYEGEFYQDMMCGHGTFHYPSGSSYTGQWERDMPDGYGEECWKDGSVFEGQFSCGVKEGRGSFRWANGCKFEGEFRQNSMHGEGLYIWSNGRSYEGQWSSNELGPEGRFCWPDGKEYHGQLLHGRRHGQGKLKLKDGSFYEGQWLAGKQHGRGRTCTTAGRIRCGEWTVGHLMQWEGGPGGAQEVGKEVEQLWHDSNEVSPEIALDSAPTTCSASTASSHSERGIEAFEDDATGKEDLCAATETALAASDAASPKMSAIGKKKGYPKGLIPVIGVPVLKPLSVAGAECTMSEVTPADMIGSGAIVMSARSAI